MEVWKGELSSQHHYLLKLFPWEDTNKKIANHLLLKIVEHHVFLYGGEVWKFVL